MAVTHKVFRVCVGAGAEPFSSYHHPWEISSSLKSRCCKGILLKYRKAALKWLLSHSFPPNANVNVYMPGKCGIRRKDTCIELMHYWLWRRREAQPVFCRRGDAGGWVLRCQTAVPAELFSNQPVTLVGSFFIFSRFVWCSHHFHVTFPPFVRGSVAVLWFFISRYPLVARLHTLLRGSGVP